MEAKATLAKATMQAIAEDTETTIVVKGALAVNNLPELNQIIGKHLPRHAASEPPMNKASTRKPTGASPYASSVVPRRQSPTATSSNLSALPRRPSVTLAPQS